MNDPCRSCRETWHALADGLIHQDTRQDGATSDSTGAEHDVETRMRRHLDTCAECRSYVNDMNALTAAFDELAVATVEVGADTDDSLGITRPEIRSRKAAWPRHAVRAAAVLALATGLYWAANGVRSRTTPVAVAPDAGSGRPHSSVSTDPNGADQPSKSASATNDPKPEPPARQTPTGITLQGQSASVLLAVAGQRTSPEVHFYRLYETPNAWKSEDGQPPRNRVPSGP